MKFECYEPTVSWEIIGIITVVVGLVLFFLIKRVKSSECRNSLDTAQGTEDNQDLPPGEGEALAEFSSRHWTPPSVEPSVDPKDSLPYSIHPKNSSSFPANPPAFLNNPPEFPTNPPALPTDPPAYTKDPSQLQPVFPTNPPAYPTDSSVYPEGEEVTRPMLGGGFVLPTSSQPQENQFVGRFT